jgi:TonB family protein
MTRHKKTTPSTQKHLSQDSVEQYLFGKSTEASRHRIERQLLDDKFSSEAIEGLSKQTGAKQMHANMGDLKARLQQRIAQQKQKRGGVVMPFGMQPYAIAASVALVLVCAIAVLFSTKYFEKTQATEPLAQKVEALPPAEAAPSVARNQVESATPSQELATSPANAAEAASEADANTLEEKKTVQPTSKSKEEGYTGAIADNNPVASSPKIVASESAKPVTSVDDTKAALDKTVLADATKPMPAAKSDIPVMMEEKMAAVPQESIAETEARRESFKAKKELRSSSLASEANASPVAKTPGTGTKIVKGRVIDAEDGLAIPGTVVTVKGTNISAYTDQNGEYALSVPEDGELSFNFIGYVTYRVPVEQQSVINARLSPDVKSLSEVVVIGADNKDTNTASTYRPAQPEKGMPEFMKTIEQRLEASPNADYNSAGVIKLSFTVQPDGSLTNVKVLKSLCPECDQAAVQALTEADRWKPAQENGKPVSQKMKIRVPFKPKKK